MYGFFGWLVGWLIGCLACWLAVKSTKLEVENRSTCSKNHAVGSQNRQQSVARGLWERSWGFQEASWMGSLGSFWGQEGSMIEKTSKMGRLASPMGDKFGAHNRSKNRSWGDQKDDHFLYRFLNRFLEPFGAIWAPSCPPKPSQNRAKLVLKSMKIGA